MRMRPMILMTWDKKLPLTLPVGICPKLELEGRFIHITITITIATVNLLFIYLV